MASEIELDFVNIYHCYEGYLNYNTKPDFPAQIFMLLPFYLAVRKYLTPFSL